MDHQLLLVKATGVMSQSGARLSVETFLGLVLRLLFLPIYVNDIVRARRGLDLVLFVDDKDIVAEGRDPTELHGRLNWGLG